jgi:hypothetical protein
MQSYAKAVEALQNDDRMFGAFDMLRESTVRKLVCAEDLPAQGLVGAEVEGRR